MELALQVVGAVLLAIGSGLIIVRLIRNDQKEDLGQMSEGWRRERQMGRRGGGI